MGFQFMTERYDVGCTIEIQNTFESLHAHVDLDDAAELKPGDRVRVHGDIVVVEYGVSMSIRRIATVVKVNSFQSFFARIKGDLEIFEMFEVSFSDGRPV